MRPLDHLCKRTILQAQNGFLQHLLTRGAGLQNEIDGLSAKPVSKDLRKLLLQRIGDFTLADVAIRQGLSPSPIAAGVPDIQDLVLGHAMPRSLYVPACYRASKSMSRLNITSYLLCKLAGRAHAIIRGVAPHLGGDRGGSSLCAYQPGVKRSAPRPTVPWCTAHAAHQRALRPRPPRSHRRPSSPSPGATWRGLPPGRG